MQFICYNFAKYVPRNFDSFQSNIASVRRIVNFETRLTALYDRNACTDKLQYKSNVKGYLDKNYWEDFYGKEERKEQNGLSLGSSKKKRLDPVKFSATDITRPSFMIFSTPGLISKLIYCSTTRLSMDIMWFLCLTTKTWKSSI